LAITAGLPLGQTTAAPCGTTTVACGGVGQLQEQAASTAAANPITNHERMDDLVVKP
jgi:hypothetical protein